jgi:acetyl esterase/lipase
MPAMQSPERLSYGSDPNQFVDFRWAAHPSTPTVLVMIHGGFWRSRYDLAHSADLCQALTNAGLHTANIEYRRVGQPGGGFPGTLDDVRQAVHFVRTRVNAPLSLMGHSAGGHLALWLAGELPHLLSVIALAPVASLRLAYDLNLSNGAVHEFLGGGPHDVPDRFAAADPTTRPAQNLRLLIHGSADDIVPIDLSRAYVAAHSSDSVPPRLLELDGADHSAVVDPKSPFWRTVLPVWQTTRFLL